MTSNRFRIVFWLTDTDQERTGKRARSLARLVALGHPVADGFAVNADAYRTHFWRSGAKNLAADGVSPESAAEIRRMILREPLAPDVSDAVASAYAKLCPNNEPVTVRPSTYGDESTDSELDQVYDSNQTASGIDGVLGAIKKVWSSLWTDEAIEARERLGITGEPLAAVLLQKKINALTTGRIYTANPTSGDPCQVVVRTVPSEPGRYEDHYTVDLASHTVCEKCSHGEQVMPDADILCIAELALTIDDQFGTRIEAEWAYDGSRFLILQAVPMLELSPHFPVEWAVQSEEKLGWDLQSRTRLSHFMRSLPVFSRKRLGTPLGIARSLILRRTQNGYAYSCTRWPWDPDNPASMSRLRRFRVRLTEDRACRKLLGTWEKQVRPYITGQAQKLLKPDYTRLSNRKLKKLLRRATYLHDLMLEWYDILWYPGRRIPEKVREMVMGAGFDEHMAVRILSGALPASVERDCQLLAIASEIAGRSGAWDKKAEDSVRMKLAAFAKRYGYSYTSAQEMCDIACWRSWLEDMGPVSDLVWTIAEGDAKDPLKVGEESLRDSQAALEEVCRKLGRIRRRRLRKLVKLALRWLPKMAERDMVLARVQTALRQAAIELGRRLVKEKTLGEPNDIFLFTHDELLKLPVRPDQSKATCIKRLVIERKHQLWLESRLVAPQRLPVPPIGPGRTCPADPMEISGDAGSPGLVVGLARVAGSIEDASLLRSGEILIAAETGPAWTPYLSIAAGLVTEGGSKLSPEAVLARGYGIPCVHGAQGATEVIRTGDLIAVDGTRGLVQRRHLASDAAKKLEKAE